MRRKCCSSTRSTTPVRGSGSPEVSIVPPSQGSSSTSGASQRESSLGSVSQRQVSSRSAGSTISLVTLAIEPPPPHATPWLHYPATVELHPSAGGSSCPH